MRTNFGREAYKHKKIPFSVQLGKKLKSQIEEIYCKTQVCHTGGNAEKNKWKLL